MGACWPESYYGSQGIGDFIASIRRQNLWWRGKEKEASICGVQVATIDKELVCDRISPE